MSRIAFTLWNPYPAEPEVSRKAAHAILLGAAVVVFGMFGTGLWLAFAQLAGAVIAPGMVKVDLNRRPVQHQEGGIIRQVLVRDGARVRAGEPLIVLGDVGVQAGFEIAQAQLLSERARRARLEAERSLAPSIEFPSEISSATGNARFIAVTAKERALFTARRRALDEQIALLRQQTETVQREIVALESQIKADESSLRLQRDEYDQNVSLSREGYISRNRVITVERAVADYESKLAEHLSELARAQQRLVDTALRIGQLRDTYTTTASAELSQASEKINELEERLRASADAAKRQEIVAPVSGEVVDLKYTTAGAVVSPRETLLDIIPADPRLLVEVHVRPEDASHVSLGSGADIRFTSFPYRTTPLVQGKVVYFSADRLTEKASGQPYYQGLIEADPESLGKASDIKLSAGLPAEVYIRTVERSALLYLLEPVTSYLRRAVRER